MNIRPLLKFLVIAVMLIPSSSYAQSFGKIFSTPQERHYLDRLRTEMFAELDEVERMEALQQPVIVIPEIESELIDIHLGGTVRRADGSHTIWVNGVPVDEKSLPSNARLEFQRGMGVLIVDTSEGVFTLRPGQTLNANLGEVREDYELTPAQLESIQRELARREALNRPIESASSASPQQSSATAEAEEVDAEQQALVQQVLEAISVLQQAREAADALP